MKLFSQDDINKIEHLTLAERGLNKQEMIDEAGKDIAAEISARYD